MALTVKAVYDLVDGLAPFSTAEEYDNAGLITGRFGAPVNRILTALDCTMEVVREARRLKAELILTHHPLLFHARKNLREEDAEARVLCELIRGHIALLCAHTNLDRAPGGTNDVLASLFSLKNVRGTGFVRCGELSSPMAAAQLQQAAAAALHAPVRLYGDPNKPIKTLGVGCGAYDEGYGEAAALGASAYLTGEVRHHNAVAAVQEGIVLLEAGHYATEAPGLRALGECLQTALNGLQCSVSLIHFSGTSYPGALDG